jgi:fibronectin-binding autotransporter adhesin
MAHCARNPRAPGLVRAVFTVVGAVVLMVTVATGQGVPLYWDSTNPGTTLDAGDGAWSLGNGDKNWNPSTTPTNGSGVPWENGRQAVFQGSGTSLVTVSGAVQVNGIHFVGTGYTIGGTTLTLTGSNLITTTSAGTINAPLGGTVGLNKLGAATLTLGGVSSYSGATSVSTGTLLVSGTGSLPVGSAVSVENAAFLTGTGTVGGATTVKKGGTLSPGTVGTPGSQSYTNGIAFIPESIFQWDLSIADPANTASTSVYDQIVGTAAGTGTFNVNVLAGNFADNFWKVNQSWTGIFSGGNLATIFTTVTSSALPSQGNFSFSGTTLNWNAVPEPSTALAGILLGLGLLRRRR